MGDDLNIEARYRWGMEVFRTPKRYGIGFELNVNGRFLIGVRVGSLWLSLGQQLDHFRRVEST